MRDEEEDWPALQPKRIVSTGSVQDMLRENGSELKRQVEEERYPKLGDTSQNPFRDDQLPVSAYSPLNKMLRQEGSVADVKAEESSATVNITYGSDGATDVVHDHQDVKHATQSKNKAKEIQHPSRLSASAAALEKSGSQDLPEVRQTRTSSLRARLSAGEVTKDRNGKVVGFTDFTADPNGLNHREALRDRKEAHARRLSSPPRLNLKASRESIGNRAPAKFIAGSRRPTQPRRPASRSSLHDDMRAGAHSSAMPSTAVPRPASRNEESRRSSIPVSSAVAVDAVNGSAPLKARSSSKSVTRFPVKPVGHHPQPKNGESNVFSNGTDTSKETPATNDTELIATDEGEDDAQGLPSIDESPRNLYKIKRLSTKSPEHGPTLTISPSADRYIMGYCSDSDKENLPLSKEGAMEPKTSNGPTQITKRISSVTKKRLERPNSSNGRPSPRGSMLDPKEREKKVKSVDLGTASKSLEIVPPKTLSKNPSVITNASSMTGPFFDASEDPLGDSDITPKASMSIPQDQWISPLAKDTANAQQNGTDALTRKPSIYVPQKNRLSGDSYDPFKYDNEKPVAKPAVVKADRPVVSTDNFATPKVHQTKPTSPDNHPPRNSSRKDKPAVAVTTTKTVSATAITQETGPPTPPKDFSSRKNNPSSSRGLRTSQIDALKSSASKDHRSETSGNNRSSVISNRKRDSTARESLKSHASSTLPHSVSKSRFNIKGLFHKRSTETRPNTPVLKPKRSKVSITASGSPVAPHFQSDIHPVHRTNYRPASPSSPTKPPSPRKDTQIHPTVSPSIITATTTTLDATTTTKDSFTQPTTLALSLLDSARREHSSPQKKNQLFNLGKVLVEVITKAREAEKAVEEAKMALGRAEEAREACVGAVDEAVRLVGGARGS